MEGLRRFLAIVVADLLERLRSLRFWLVIALIAGATWWCFPPTTERYMVLGFEGYRGRYSSAWIGMVLSMLLIWLSLIGFYVIRGSLTRDIESKVWQLLIATPMRRATYLFAKWCGHVFVLTLIVAAAAIVGLVAQVVRAEDRNIEIIELLKPLFLLGLPSLSVTAMIAIVFDLIPSLRRTAGNILYFALWLASLASTQFAMQMHHDSGSDVIKVGDPIGIMVFNHDLHKKISEQYGGAPESGFCMVCGMKQRSLVQLDWSEWTIQTDNVLGRMYWLGLALLGVLLSARFLDRVVNHTGPVVHSTSSQQGLQLRWVSFVLRPLQGSAMGALVVAELQMLLRLRKVWWWLGVGVAWLVEMLAREPRTVAIALIGTLLISLASYSRSALHERETGITAIVFSAPSAGKQVLFARWLALLILINVLSLPAIFRFMSIAPLVTAAILIVGISVVTWGFAFGALTKNARTFELIVCALAYLALDDVAVLNVESDPLLTLAMHMLALPIAVMTLLLVWPRLRQS